MKLTTLLVGLIDDHKFDPKLQIPDKPEAERIRALQTAGSMLRRAVGGDAMAQLALARIRQLRANPDSPNPNTAYLLNQLKNPAEADLLRSLFGDRFILIGAGSNRETRRVTLAKRLAESDAQFDYSLKEPDALKLINVDEHEEGNKAGQRVRDLFHRSDLFVDPDDESITRSSIERFVQLLFGNPFQTPTVDELGMRLAHTVALRSAALGRQVGAALMRADGTVISVGANDVPRAGGGVYWPHHDPDGRDHAAGRDSSNELQQRMIAEFLTVLKASEWLKKGIAGREVTELVGEALESGMLKGLRAMSLVEFGRTLHAEMNAILDAARHGAALQDATIYGTTYPCHECTRHIIGAGQARVVFIEPYPKSLADTLHEDAIAIGSGGSSAAVTFDPFVGVAPRRFDQLFQMHAERKDGLTGKIVDWQPRTATPVVEDRWGPIVARAIESVGLDGFLELLEALPS